MISLLIGGSGSHFTASVLCYTLVYSTLSSCSALVVTELVMATSSPQVYAGHSTLLGTGISGGEWQGTIERESVVRTVLLKHGQGSGWMSKH